MPPTARAVPGALSGRRTAASRPRTFDDYPRELPKREIEVSEAAARSPNAAAARLD
jgi:hypothetical protein